MRRQILPFIVLALIAGTATAQGFDECGDLANAYGPFDYRTSKDKLAIVEGAHFTADVESLRRGTTGTLGGDIDYTLRASPNHHRALIAMMTLARRSNTDRPQGANYTLACYFDRAARFAPDDAVVRLIYGTYLSRVNKRSAALEQLGVALQLDPDNANIHYNLGLIYVDMKDYPKARLHARRAYELGFTLPGLKKRLEDAGQWEGPVPAAPARSAEAPKAQGAAVPK